jgi:hypothetical protein
MSRQSDQAAPHSWSVARWPAHVWPGDSTKGRRFVRTYEKELLKYKALTRMGREPVVMGAGFTRFMAAQAYRAADFEVPCNRPEHLAKRHNGHDVQNKPRRINHEATQAVD